VTASKAWDPFGFKLIVFLLALDKTQVFHDQIEQKQKELQPWKTKVNQKQAEIDIKTSERDMLIKKAETIKQASAEALEGLENLRSDQKNKVCVFDNPGNFEDLFYAQIGELENLKHRKQSLQQESKTAQQRVQVGGILCGPVSNN